VECRVCDLENLKNEEAMTRFASQRHSKKKGHVSIIMYTKFAFTLKLLIPMYINFNTKRFTVYIL
jgi:hypothetical protein